VLKKELLLIGFIILLASPAYSEETTSFNPRDDYVFGIGTMVGGPMGVVGIISDFNWYSLANIGIGLGSGVHYDTFMAQGKYLILDRAFTPYLGGGLAYWRSTGTGAKIAAKSEAAVDLGLVEADGSDRRSGILLLPLSFGVHYVSGIGLAVFTEVEYLISISRARATPYGALGFQWYF